MGAAPSKRVEHKSADSTATAAAETAPQSRAASSRISNASCPATFGTRPSVTTRPAAPPVWDPRSPSAARTPKRKVREIRASVVLQEQTRKAIAELEAKEAREERRRRSTQVTGYKGSTDSPKLAAGSVPSDATATTGASWLRQAKGSPLPTILSPSNRTNAGEDAAAEDEDEDPCFPPGHSEAAVGSPAMPSPRKKARANPGPGGKLAPIAGARSQENSMPVASM